MKEAQYDRLLYFVRSLADNNVVDPALAAKALLEALKGMETK